MFLLLADKPHLACRSQLMYFIGHSIDLVGKYSFFVLELISDHFMFSILIDIIRIYLSMFVDLVF